MSQNDNRNKNKIAQDKIELLDSYFANRHNAAGTDEHGRRYVRERKTTVEIVDELSDMLDIDKNELFAYMRSEGYQMASHIDGTLRWEIWREPADIE